MHRFAAAVVLALTFARPAAAQSCVDLVQRGDARVGLHGDPDLRCFDLTPSPWAVERARGRVHMLRRPGPFTVDVTPEGVHVWRLVIDAGMLPEDPPGIDPAHVVYTAWATTPVLEPMIRLGALADGRVVADVALDKFLVLVSAEETDTTTVRRGPLVLRGMSPSMRLQADHTPWLLSMVATNGDSASRAHAHRHAPTVDGGWPYPAMPEDIVMLSGMMPRLPNVSPYRPGETAAGVTSARTAARSLTAARHGDGFAWNDSVPGPTLRVRQNDTIDVRFANRSDLPMTIHWHGLRVANAFDGVAHHTQPPVEPGDFFDYRLTFPDAGVFWYHPHERADIGQDLGLYGNIVVEPSDTLSRNVVHDEILLMLDDVLLTADGARMPHGREAATHALMGRFGDRLLINGDSAWSTTVSHGAVVRFLITNAASTRVFNLSFGVDSVKLVGGDIGSYVRETWVRSLPIAPAERYVVEVHYDGAGPFPIENRIHAIDHIMGSFLERVDTMGLVRVDRSAVAAAPAHPYAQLRSDLPGGRSVSIFANTHLGRAVDHTLLLRMEADSLPFPLDRLMRLDSAYFHPVEWGNTMPDMNWILDAREVRWILEDAETGARGHDIRWLFRRRDVARIRIVNPRGSLHAMQHPIHLHGQRFVVLEQDGVRNDNFVWKDTVLVPVGSWIDILVDFSNPGAWMLHCHIAEHMEAGMHTMVEVR